MKPPPNYTDFGLTPADDRWFSTADAGRQLRLLPAPVRRLLELRVGADDVDDLARAAAGLGRHYAGSNLHPEDLAAMMTGAHSAR